MPDMKTLIYMKTLCIFVLNSKTNKEKSYDWMKNDWKTSASLVHFIIAILTI